MIDSVQAADVSRPADSSRAGRESASGDFQQQLALFWPYGRLDSDPRAAKSLTRQAVREVAAIDTSPDAARRRRDR